MTRTYTFYIASDDGSELYLSTDADPAHKTKICYNQIATSPRLYTRYASEKSAAITLQANQKYYFEILHKEHTGGDHVSVAWDYQVPPGGVATIIAGAYLSPWVNATAQLELFINIKSGGLFMDQRISLINHLLDRVLLRMK